ncbi:hypothetical protein C9994_04335 [Marivirga lumbricoides]|uniref:Uncharacterized protein n=1 Tax=Marivirga lumbricoides TaxID=1046115 RepID=A0A2T4DTD9_9BACT|nr:hypothetical protein C9994_04335 [Marivirga lumbricoides]
MRLIVSLFIFFSLNQVSFCQLIHLQLESNSDTIRISEPLIIDIHIKNISDKAIFLPSDFFAISNILPNGLENNIRGFYIDFTIEPVNSWSTVHIENTARSDYTQFIKLRPNDTAKFEYDLNQHIRYLNSKLQTDSLKVPLNTELSISSHYYNSRLKPKREDRTATATVESNKLNIVLIE